MLLKWVAVVVACSAAVPAWAVYRCKNAAGALVYQDAPCDGVGDNLRILGAGKADPGSAGATYWRREVEKNKRDAAVQQAIGNREVMIGMTAAEVMSSWGKPQAVNTTVSASGRTEQWVYRRGTFAAQYVYLDNGVVRSMQDAQ